MKVAVVTPYHIEDVDTLRRCHESVRRQSYACAHIMVGDGHARAEIDAWEAQHLKLPLAHGDYGNTPRGLGGISALNQGFDGVAYLDADNWYSDDHIETMVAYCRESGCAVAFGSRRIVLSTGEISPYLERDEVERRHVDTSCFFITAEAAFLLPVWAMIDPKVSAVGDRIMLNVVRSRGVSHGWTGRFTVFYESRWPGHFRSMGKPPPPDANKEDLDEVVKAYSTASHIARLGFDPMRRS